MVRKKVTKWFEAGEATGWQASDSQEKRIRTIVKSRSGDLLAAGRALVALSNVQAKQNPTVSRKAKSDADLLLKRYKKTKRRR